MKYFVQQEQRIAKLERQLAETQHALAMEKSGRSGEVCDMCNFIERADCVDQKDELRAEIERLKVKERDYRSTLQSIASWTKPYTFERLSPNEVRASAREALNND